MALLDFLRSPFEAMGKNLENYMGGLLGDDVEQMSPEERRRLRQRAISAIAEGLATSTPVSVNLREAADEELRRRQRIAQQGQQQQRMQEAQQASSQIAGRLLGGMPMPTAPGPMAGDELTGVNVQSAYRRDPQDALRMAMTPAGMEAMKINPFLQPALQEAMKPPALPEYVSQVVPGVGLVSVNKNDPSDSRVVQRIQVPKEPEKQKFDVLTAQEVAAAGLAPGTVVQRNKETGNLSILQAATSIPDPRGFNDRQRSGANVLEDAALNYASNLTGMSKAELAGMTPAQIEALMVERGGRITQGGVARAIRGIPFVGQGVLETVNSDLAAAATAGGAALAMIQNPTGPITSPDVEIGKLQFPSPIYPVEVQAQMLRGLLEQVRPAAPVEQYDEKGNRIGQDRRGSSGRF